MSNIEFVWDARKAAENLAKHGVSFEEAQSVFYDEHARHMADPEHSNTEDRFILLGMSTRLRLLVVCHCFRQSDSVVRLISARKSTARERALYEELL